MVFELLEIVDHAHQHINYAIEPFTALAVGSAALKGITGAAQFFGAGGKKTPQPRFQVPKGYKERLGRIKTRAAMGSELPGQTLMEQKIGASTSEGIEAYKEAGNQANLQEMIAQSVMNEQKRYADLGVKAAEFQYQKELEVDEAMRQGEEYDIMKQKRDMEIAEAKEAERLASRGAGIKNITGALDTAVEIGTTFGGGGGKRLKKEDPLKAGDPGYSDII